LLDGGGLEDDALRVSYPFCFHGKSMPVHTLIENVWQLLNPCNLEPEAAETSAGSTRIKDRIENIYKMQIEPHFPIMGASGPIRKVHLCSFEQDYYKINDI